MAVTFAQFKTKMDSYAAKAAAAIPMNKDVILAQWGNESGNGTSSRAVNDNNYGGIKYSQYSTTAIKKSDGFARYASIDGFVTDYIRVMKLSYYSGVRAAAATPGIADDVKALGESPYDAGHYTTPGQAPGSKIASILGTTTGASTSAPKPKPPAVCPTCHRPL